MPRGMDFCLCDECLIERDLVLPVRFRAIERLVGPFDGGVGNCLCLPERGADTCPDASRSHRQS